MENVTAILTWHATAEEAIEHLPKKPDTIGYDYNTNSIYHVEEENGDLPETMFCILSTKKNIDDYLDDENSIECIHNNEEVELDDEFNVIPCDDDDE